ncbi:glycosyl transferase family A [Nostoc sp. T09]|uniref:glycosyltransferase n=1 Tax=Nostoc sp. T09 TaxID=1932621 RepID=UPI000A3744C5|nr:glycosyltransferase [Nostoc sp. T09]OUL37625.1 glycosyl transferase family A [Nostoc sp. T09]
MNNTIQNYPKISVVIPAYNCQKTIKATIESVLQQTFADFELIVINDGSQDATLEIVSQINDSRLKIFSFENAGANISRNRGLNYAIGEFVSFLDADDLWIPEKLESQLQALQANSQASVAYSWTNCIDEKGQFLRRGTYIAATGNVYAQLLVINFLESGSNPLIRREALIAVGGFDKSLPAGQDWDIYLRLAANYHFVPVPYPQILYRISASSLSTNVVRQEAACLTVIERAFKQAPEHLQYLKNYSLANIYKYLLYKALEGSPARNKAILAAKLLWQTIRHDCSILQKPAYFKALLKICILFLFTPAQAKLLLEKLPKFSNVSTILGYLQIEI